MAPVALIAFVAISTILVAVTMKSAKAKKAAEQNERAKHEALESLSRRILATRNTKIAAQVGEIIKTKHRQREVGNGNAK